MEFLMRIGREFDISGKVRRSIGNYSKRVIEMGIFAISDPSYSIGEKRIIARHPTFYLTEFLLLFIPTLKM
jgi:hypothetical protein